MSEELERFGTLHFMLELWFLGDEAGSSFGSAGLSFPAGWSWRPANLSRIQYGLAPKEEGKLPLPRLLFRELRSGPRMIDSSG